MGGLGSWAPDAMVQESPNNLFCSLKPARACSGPAQAQDVSWGPQLRGEITGWSGWTGFHVAASPSDSAPSFFLWGTESWGK